MEFTSELICKELLLYGGKNPKVTSSILNHKNIIKILNIYEFLVSKWLALSDSNNAD